MQDRLNRVLILRLVRYVRVLRKLKDLGFVRVFSNNLADAVGVTAAVVRKDLSTIHVTGNKRGGYQVDELMHDIQTVIGTPEKRDIILVGCGRIGRALMAYPEFLKEGVRIVAGFDVNPAVVDREARIPILPIDELPEVLRNHPVDVAVLAVPDSAASEVFGILHKNGVHGVLNFSTVDLKCDAHCPDSGSCSELCIVQNVNISLEIENLFYLVNLESGMLRIPSGVL